MRIIQPYFSTRDSYPGINRENGIYGNHDPGKVVASSQRAEPGKPYQSWISYLFNRIMRRSQKPPRRLPHQNPYFRHRRRQVLHNYQNYVPYNPHRHYNHYMKRVLENNSQY